MKKISFLFCLLIIALIAPTAIFANPSSSHRNNKKKTTQTTTVGTTRSDATYKSIQQLYTQGKISADSVINLAVYHKVWSPELAERCLKLVTDKNPRSATELGALYAFSPEFAKRKSEGVKLLEAAAKEGSSEANCYLGLYYFNKKDYKKAKTYFDACQPMDYGIGYTALGSMYLTGNGVKENPVKARENFHQAALKGYPRGAALYGFNLRTNTGGQIDYPDSFFWLYIAGDLGDDTARTTLFLPRRNEKRADTEVGRDATTALQFIEAAQTGKKIQNEPIYKDGFLPSLKAREKAAEQGDDWARFYLGSMNYNGDFLNQNYTQVIHYYEPIAQNGKLPRPVLALVHERLAEMYRDGKGTKADSAKAARHARIAAQYGSLPAYKIIENISE